MDGKFLINAEFNLLDSGEAEQNHMNEIHDKYVPSPAPTSSFAQMGYLTGRVPTEAMLGIQDDITKESVNEAFKNLKAVHSSICGASPGTSTALSAPNVSNNTDITVDAAGRQDGADRGLLRDRRAPDANPLAQIRSKEQELGLNA